MQKFGSKQFIPTGTALLAVVWIYLGLTKYGFWDGVKGPTPGFVPTIVAVLMLAVSLLALAQSFKEEKPVYPMENWLVILAGFGIFAGCFVIGLVASLIIYVVVWLKLYEKCSWKATVQVLAITMLITLGVFYYWLGVPFPKGMLFELILG